MQNHRNLQQSRSSAIKIQIQHQSVKVPGSAKHATSKASQPQKSSHEVIRHLVQDLDRYKDENEELRASLTHITRSYLLEKSQVEDLTSHITNLNQGPGQQQRNIEKLVAKQLAISQKDTLKIIEEQKQTIEKYRKYKVCLSKNVNELQERLKATRQELQQTQRQLFSLQQGQPASPVHLIPKKLASLGSEDGPNTNKKSNKIMHMEFDQNEVETHEKATNPSIPGRQARYMVGNQAQGGVKASKVIRNGMQVAKSMALNLGEQKYDWLFNDDSTPREQPENILSERDSARYPTTHTGKKLVSSGLEGIPQSDRSDNQTMTSTNNKSIINQKMKQTPHVLNNNLEEFSRTIESNREHADESLLILNQQKSQGINDQGNGRSHSIVKKSLNNVKSIIKKAKEGLRASGQAENISEIEKKYYSHPFEVNHEQVQIELATSQAPYGQNWPNGQSRGEFSANEPQNTNKSLINDFGDQNPLDDDSN